MAELIEEAIDDKHFKCAKCGEVFEKSLTDEEAMDKCTEVFGRPLSDEESLLVCDDCWNEMKPVIFN